MAGHDFILDVDARPSTREVSGIFAGDPVQAHAAGVEFLRTTSPRTGSLRLADAAYDCCHRPSPLDLTFYQTIKGLTAAQHIVKPGGRILILGECAEGVGSPEFAGKVAGFSSYESFLDEIKNADVEIDQWQLEKLALAGQKNELFFYLPGISNDKLGTRLASSSPFSLSLSWKAAIAAVLEGLPGGARVALVPEGPYVYARVPEEAQAVLV